MMMSEFIERTGFEPTADEYREIEEEYMGCNDDKDTFCNNWKKYGGIQRLTRRRATKIENLESRVLVLEKEKCTIRTEWNNERCRANRETKRCNDLEAENESLKASLSTLEEADARWKKTVEELKNRIAEYEKIREQISAVKNLIAVLSK